MKFFNKIKNTSPTIIHANGVWDQTVRNILDKINLRYIQGDLFECFHENNKEIDLTSKIFHFNKCNEPLDPSIGIYTWNNKAFRDKWIFEIICEINRLDYTNLIKTKEFKTFDKLTSINLEIKRLKSINSPIKYLFCADSKDVIFTDHPNVFVTKFLIEQNKKMVINAETNDYPNNITSLEQKNPMPFKYLNSGTYIAEINFLEKFTDLCLSFKEEYSNYLSHDLHALDQALFKKSYELLKDECILDINSDLFLCLYGCDQSWIDITL
jgi:hypothetical protein